MHREAQAYPPLPVRRGLSQRAVEEIWGYVFLSPWLVGFAIFTAGAMLFSLGLTLFRTDLLTGYHFLGLTNYATLIHDEYFGKALRVSATYVAGSVPLNLVLSLTLATLLNQPVPGRGAWRTLYYLPSVISGVAVSILWAWMFQPEYGLINSALGLVGITGPRWIYSEAWALPSFVIMGLWGVGGSMLIYLAGLQSIPTHLYEAAEIDGAGGWQRYLHVTLPMLSPTIFFNLVMNIIGSFQIFTASYIMTKGGPANATLTLVLYLYRASFEQFKFGYASTVAWALFLIILLCTLLTLRSSAAWVYYEGQLRR
jgi:multiple sugar transport system permease protein